MKKLLSLLAVAAIVTSAFAFTTTTRDATFCVRVGSGQSLSCDIITSQEITDNGTLYFEWPLSATKWNGNADVCRAASPITHCIEEIELKFD